jgi:hypothetical protein
MIVRMSGPATASEGQRSLTSLYLEFAEHGTAPVRDSELVIDEWPNRVQKTLGWEASQLHGGTPHVVGAAAVAAAVTNIAAGKMGAEGAAHSPTFGLFARSRTFAGFLDNLNSPRRGEGQGPGLYLVANFGDPRTPLLRTSTAPTTAVNSLFTGRNHRAPEADAIRANDELYIGSNIGRLRDLCTQAIHRALERDYGLNPENEDMLRIYTRWAIVNRFGRAMESPSTATTVHMGQFLAACQELASKLPRNTKLQDVLPPHVFSTYAQGRSTGIKPLPVREPNGSYASVQPLRRRQRTVDDVHEIMQQVQTRPPIEQPRIRAADLLSPRRVEIPEGMDLEAILAKLDGGDSCMTIMRLGKQAIQVQLGNCREETVERMKIDDRRRYVTALMNEGENLPRGGHRNGVYEDHPYLRPGTMKAIYEDDRRTTQMATNPTEAVGQLPLLQHQNSRGGRPSVREVLAAFAAASLGNTDERRQAFDTLNTGFRQRLRTTLLTLAPLLTVRSLRDVEDMQRKYGYTYEEIMDLGIPTTQQEVEIPMQVYIPAAVALLDNPDSIFAVTPRKTKALQRVWRGDAPPPDDPNGSGIAVRELQEHLYGEASTRYGVDARVHSTTTGRPMVDHLGHPVFDTQIGDLLVACRLSEGLGEAMATNPTVRANVLRLIGPVLERNDPDAVQRRMPPLVYRQFMTMRGQYAQLQQADQGGGGGRFGFRGGRSSNS